MAPGGADRTRRDGSAAGAVAGRRQGSFIHHLDVEQSPDADADGLASADDGAERESVDLPLEERQVAAETSV